MMNMSEQKGLAKKAPLGLEQDKIKTLVKSSTPKGQDPIVWYTLVRDKMGVDKQGQYRPVEDIIQFIYVCHRTGLDPIVGQIYAVYRWDTMLGREKMTIQSGIDGFRLVAQRSGDYAGQDEVVFTPIDETIAHPIKASVTVYKMIKGARVKFTASARWAEYVQKKKDGNPMGMWAGMPYNQLGKCAEALALRKGFPNELAGIYSVDEMQQADNVLSALPTPQKFIKEPVSAEVEVVHGAPQEIAATPPAPAVPGEAPEVGSAQAAEVKKMPEGTKSEQDAPKNIEVSADGKVAKKEVESTEPDLGAMRDKLKVDDTKANVPAGWGDKKPELAVDEDIR